MSTLTCEVGENAPSACLHPARMENPYGLVTLWEIVNRFDAGCLCLRATNFAICQSEFEILAAAALPLGQGLTTRFLEELAEAQHACERIGMVDEGQKFARIHEHISERPNVANASSYATEAQHARDNLIHGLKKRQFLYVDPDKAAYIDQDHLFGEKVSLAFPSAQADIRESGNCFAAECSTAAVFHLMRAVEWGLRALAVDLGEKRIRKKNKKTGKVSYTPLPWADWETILNSLKSKVGNKMTAIKRGPKKQLYQEFYYPALQDIETIRDAWRNHVMHTRREYSAEDANPIFSHVRRLMTSLASRISEV